MRQMTKTLAILSLLFLSFSYLKAQNIIAEKTFDVSAGELLYVEASGSDVKVSSWDQSRVEVTVKGSKKAASKVKVDFEKTEDGIKVIVKKKRNGFFDWFNSMGGTLVDVKTPSDFKVEIETSGGDIEIYSVNGDKRLETSGGDIKIVNTKGKLLAETSGGDIVIDKNHGNVSASTSGGDITVKSVDGNLEVSTSGGDIRINSHDGYLNAETSGGDIMVDLTGEFKGINASTSGGDIIINLPLNIDADVLLESWGGNIDCDYPNAKVISVKRDKYEARFNKGGNKLYATTSGGDIIVKER
ncbi:DUF4097 family beta strand repeat-containing protein [Melioribacter sp. OK-6-Me]|uniref:DUF4097 family beta strand repeat-containing protein n=1 Tax=unclassified Melioribacter TaxID=2627329 RepID=UPI003ED8DE1B